MLASLLAALALRALLAIDLPGIYFVAMAGAHVYDIVTDIVFWVAAAAYFTSFELRRVTSSLHLALAAGGVAGGALAGLLSQVLAAEDLLLALPPIALLAIAQLALAERRLQPIGSDEQPDDGGSLLGALRLLPPLVRRHPLILLLALNSLMLTVVYCTAEYLYFTIYTRHFADETALATFLGTVFALIQVLEFVLLYLVSRPLVERAGPLLRNLVFPSTSLACLGGLAISPALPAAIATQVNAEALSNAVFEPVNNTNYGAVPYGFHGRVRTLADGIFYPGGMAVAGVMLIALPEQPALAEVTFVALVCALLFLLVNFGIGVLFPPTLVRNLRSGVAHFADLRRPAQRRSRCRPSRSAPCCARPIPKPARSGSISPSGSTRACFSTSCARSRRRRSAEPAPHRGAARARAGRAHARAARRAARERRSGEPADRAADHAGASRCGAPRPCPALAAAPDRSVAALALLVAAGPGGIAGASGPLAQILPWCRDAEVAADLIDACGSRGTPISPTCWSRRSRPHRPSSSATGSPCCRASCAALTPTPPRSPCGSRTTATPSCAPRRSRLSARSPTARTPCTRSARRSPTRAGWSGSGLPPRSRRRASARSRSRPRGLTRPTPARSRRRSRRSAGSARAAPPGRLARCSRRCPRRPAISTGCTRCRGVRSRRLAGPRAGAPGPQPAHRRSRAERVAALGAARKVTALRHALPTPTSGPGPMRSRRCSRCPSAACCSRSCPAGGDVCGRPAAA